MNMSTYKTLPDDYNLETTPFPVILECYPGILDWQYTTLQKEFGDRAYDLRRYAVMVYTDYISWQGYQESLKPISPMFQKPLICDFDAA